MGARVSNAAVLCLVLATLVLSSLSQAAVPTAINFQGRLTTPAGVPVADGSYSVTFTVYDAFSGGTSTWTETQSVTTSDGLFAVLLGTVSPITDTVFNSTTRYLGLKVGIGPELTPRTRLVSVPFADRVSTVDGSSGGSIGGNLNLDNSTTTTGNIYKNGTLFMHNVGSGNTFAGANAGNLSMSGTDNTSYGAGSMQNNTTGIQNTAVGLSALASNTSGSFNTATGLYALYTNTGDGNSAFGHNALQSNTSGYSNCAFGKDAMISNTTGDSNTASGYQTLFYNTSGRHNTACGFQALFGNIGGVENTATGFLALLHNTGSHNTASGSQALISNTTGIDNTSYGASSLPANTTGEKNTAVGYYSIETVTTGWGNTAIGANSLSNITYENYNTALGSSASVNPGVEYSVAIGVGAIATASNMIRLGSSFVTKIEGQVAYTFTSDRNQKENFLPVDGNDVLHKIRDLNLTSWNYKNNDPKQFRHYGPVAQEFFAAFGRDSIGTCGDSVSINSGDEVGVLMIAVQTMEKERERMQEEKELLSGQVESISADNQKLRAELDELKNKLDKLAARM